MLEPPITACSYMHFTRKVSTTLFMDLCVRVRVRPYDFIQDRQITCVLYTAHQAHHTHRLIFVWLDPILNISTWIIPRLRIEKVCLIISFGIWLRVDKKHADTRHLSTISYCIATRKHFGVQRNTLFIYISFYLSCYFSERWIMNRSHTKAYNQAHDICSDMKDIRTFNPTIRRFVP